MISYFGYHANEENKVKDACDNKSYHYSEGNGHWLGDGSYFFEDDPIGNGLTHAQAWNHKQKHTNPAAYTADINVEEVHLCNLEDKNTRLLINKLQDRFFLQMMKLGKLPKNGYMDGLFFNMWDTVIKKKRIDLIRRNDFYQTIPHQLAGVKSGNPNVYVLCVRNTKKCIENPKRCY